MNFKSFGLDKRTNSCIRVNTRELDKEFYTKVDYLIYLFRWSVLTTVHPTLNDHVCYDLKSLGLDNRTTLVLSNIRKLDRELFYKLVYLI